MSTASTASSVSTASTASTVRTDVIVVGAGIIGASCAFHLARRGLRVDVLEAQAAPAMGSTGRSFASVRSQWADETNARLSWESIQTYRDPATFGQATCVGAISNGDASGSDVGYRPTGYLLLVPDGRWEAHLDAVDLQRSLGIPVEVMSPGQARRLTDFDPRGIGGCTWGPADGVVDPHLVTTGYLRLARQQGASVHRRAPVTAVRRTPGGWLVQTPEQLWGAPTVVNAAGGWAGDIAALAGLTVPVEHVRRVVFASAAQPDAPRFPMTIDVGTGVYLRSEGERLLFGKANEAEPAGYRTDVDWAWLEPTLEVACRRFPWLAEVPIDANACWAGTYEMTSDHRPFIGEMPGAEGWVNACGFSGHGVMQAPAVGRLVAEEVVDGRAHSIDIDPLRIERLGTGAVPRMGLTF